MDLTGMQWAVLVIMMVFANLPWVSERCFFVLACEKKSAWLRWLEWLILYVVGGVIALAVEYKMTGSVYSQGWEFYWVVLFLFMVFAFPGFVYRYVR